MNQSSGVAPTQQNKKSVLEGLPQRIAGVELVDTEFAKRATALAAAASPSYLFNHAVRTFLFASLIGRSGRMNVDPEVLYLGCILHDLGLTERYIGALPFEIQGAEAARKFLLEIGYPADKTTLVWDAIAMHPSMIGHFKAAEIRLVGEGAGADVAGPDPSIISSAQTSEIIAAFPRLSFKTAFVKNCAEVITRYPNAATRSFMRDIGERYVPNFRPRNICDAIADAPFRE